MRNKINKIDLFFIYIIVKGISLDLIPQLPILTNYCFFICGVHVFKSQNGINQMIRVDHFG